MSLFTGTPNPGYPGYITFTPSGGSAVTLPAHTGDYDTSMKWTPAPIFNSNGLEDHSKGLSGGIFRASGIWDTGKNIMDTISVGDVGLLINGLNANPDQMQCAQAKVARWHVNQFAPTQASWDADFIIDGAWDDYSGGTANNPTVVL